jgi:hypothetical protein
MVDYYYIAGDRYQGSNGSIKFSDLIQNAMSYANKQKSEEFKRLRERAIKNSKDSLHKFFAPEDTSKPTVYRCIEDEGYQISTYSSNDAKMDQICKIYGELGLDIKLLKISMKEAHRVIKD